PVGADAPAPVAEPARDGVPLSVDGLVGDDQEVVAEPVVLGQGDGRHRVPASVDRAQPDCSRQLRRRTTVRPVTRVVFGPVAMSVGVALVALVACGTGSATPQALRSGRSVYAERCSTCHG